MSLAYDKKRWGISGIYQLGSGLPYTPLSSEDISSFVQNSGKKPLTWNVDLKGYFILRDQMTLFVRANNVFDVLNQYTVYDDSGSADYTRWKRLRKCKIPENMSIRFQIGLKMKRFIQILKD